LHANGHTGVRLVVVVGTGVDSGEGVGSEHGAIAASALGRITSVLDNIGGINLWQAEN
jgi:hypothetical protein